MVFFPTWMKRKKKTYDPSNKSKKIQGTNVINTLSTIQVEGSQSPLSYNLFLDFIMYEQRRNIIVLRI
jgi:hypothetical protein